MSNETKQVKLEILERLARERKDAKRKIEEQVRSEVALRLAKLDNGVDLAAREAYDAGASISDLRRATNNKDWATARAMLDRTANLAQSTKPMFEPQITDSTERLTVRRGGFEAVFDVNVWDDGTLFFETVTPRYEDNVLNPIVVELDGTIGGELYDEASNAWDSR